MPKEYSRTDRVADYLTRELARLMQFEMRDPRIGMAAINDIQVSRDMSQAKVYVTFVDKQDDKACEEATAALNHAAGYLRTQIAGDNTMRTTPRLRFYYDRSIRHGAEVSALIDKAISEDARHHGHDEN